MNEFLIFLKNEHNLKKSTRAAEPDCPHHICILIYFTFTDFTAEYAPFTLFPPAVVYAQTLK